MTDLMKQWWTNCVTCDLAFLILDEHGPGIEDPDEVWEGDDGAMTCPRCGSDVDGWNGDAEVTR